MVTATKVSGVTEFVTYTCAAGTTIPINSVLTLTDPMTVAEVTATPTIAGLWCPGIAAMEKSSSDTSTFISVATNGIWKVYASGSITVGALVNSVGTGYFAACGGFVNSASGMACGYALETAATGETFLMKLKR